MADNIHIHTVTKFEELDPLPDLMEEALSDDPLHHYVLLANKGLPMQPHLRRGMDANWAEGPEHIIFQRAIEKDENGGEKVVGFSCWYFGEGFKKRDEKAEEDRFKDVGEAQKAASEPDVVEAAPPTLPAVDPTKVAEEAKQAIDNQPTYSAADEAEKEKQKRRAERAEKFIQSAFEPYGKYYDEFARGKPHICEYTIRLGEILKLTMNKDLRQMYVLPSHQGRGISSRLMRWGVEKADNLGQFCFLIATARGHTVYLRYGFEDKKVVEMDLPDIESDDETKFLESKYFNYIMLRKPVEKK